MTKPSPMPIIHASLASGIPCWVGKRLPSLRMPGVLAYRPSGPPENAASPAPATAAGVRAGGRPCPRLPAFDLEQVGEVSRGGERQHAGGRERGGVVDGDIVAHAVTDIASANDQQAAGCQPAAGRQVPDGRGGGKFGLLPGQRLRRPAVDRQCQRDSTRVSRTKSLRGWDFGTGVVAAHCAGVRERRSGTNTVCPLPARMRFSAGTTCRRQLPRSPSRAAGDAVSVSPGRDIPALPPK